MDTTNVLTIWSAGLVIEDAEAKHMSTNGTAQTAVMGADLNVITVAGRGCAVAFTCEMSASSGARVVFTLHVDGVAVGHEECGDGLDVRTDVTVRHAVPPGVHVVRVTARASWLGCKPHDDLPDGFVAYWWDEHHGYALQNTKPIMAWGGRGVMVPVDTLIGVFGYQTAQDVADALANYADLERVADVVSLSECDDERTAAMEKMLATLSECPGIIRGLLGLTRLRFMEAAR